MPRSIRSGGFTYIGILVAVAILGISLAAAGTLWRFSAQREKETELLFVGHQFRQAIARYYAAGGGAFRYPRELQDLIDDDRSPVPRHFLRQIYRDPLTGRDDWNLIRTDDGLIIGVASTSIATPIKKANFELADASFEDRECYCDWQFIYQPRRGRGYRAPANPVNPLNPPNTGISGSSIGAGRPLSPGNSANPSRSFNPGNPLGSERPVASGGAANSSDDP